MNPEAILISALNVSVLFDSECGEQLSDTNLDVFLYSSVEILMSSTNCSPHVCLYWPACEKPSERSNRLKYLYPEHRC